LRVLVKRGLYFTDHLLNRFHEHSPNCSPAHLDSDLSIDYRYLMQVSNVKNCSPLLTCSPTFFDFVVFSEAGSPEEID